MAVLGAESAGIPMHGVPAQGHQGRNESGDRCVDCFIASKKVGPSGQVIGVDMTTEMMARAADGAQKVARNLGYHNVDFRVGFLEEIPVDTESADLVTSNCVVNLSTDKMKVFQEIHRLLKQGGRFVISDIVSESVVPADMQKDRKLWGECISGALTEKEFLAVSLRAGFYGLEILGRTFYREVEGYKFWSVTLQGWKFKKGPTCNYIGQYATYLGPYSQVTDDEGHTYVRDVPFEVCTDTAIKLQQVPYAGRFMLTGTSAPKEASKVSSCAPASDKPASSPCC